MGMHIQPRELVSDAEPASASVRWRRLTLLGVVGTVLWAQISWSDGVFLPNQVCSTGAFSVHKGFPGSRAGVCTVNDTHSLQLVIHPEDEGEINPSPWYAFRVVRQTAPDLSDVRPLWIELAYASNHKHRYWPKISADGSRWKSMDASDVQWDEDAGTARIRLLLPSGQRFVSAQPLMTEQWQSQWLPTLLREWPGMVSEPIGYSVDRREITALFSNPRARKQILLLGRAHPPETTGAVAMQQFLLELAKVRRNTCVIGSDHPGCKFFADHGFMVVPMLNPDGVAHGHWRHNSAGADLNRDWGEFAQPETRAVQDRLDSTLGECSELVWVLDFHSTKRNVFFTQTEEDFAPQPDPMARWTDIAAEIAGRHGIALAHYDMDPREVSELGTAKNHFFKRYGIPSVTYETSDTESRADLGANPRVFARTLVEALVPEGVDQTLSEVGQCSRDNSCNPYWVNWKCADPYCLMVQANKASLVMLTDQGLMKPKDAAELAIAIEKVETEFAKQRRVRGVNYLSFEEDLIEMLGAKASNIHIGRSRQDLHGAARRMVFRKETLEIMQGLMLMREALVNVAGAHMETVIPAYTHGVPSQPTTLGHVLGAFADGFARDFEDLRAAYRRLNHSPLGAAAGSNSGYDIDRSKLAKLLGFRAPVENSFDANFLSSSDARIDIANAIEGSALTVTQLVQNLHAHQRNPHPWIYLAPEATSGSSIMPQKRNPRGLDRVRSAAGSSIARAHELVLLSHNVASGMHDYRQMEPMRDLTSRAQFMYGHLHRLLLDIRVDPAKALDQIRLGLSTLTEVADTLHRDAGVPFRSAHAFASALADVARQRGVAASALSAKTIRDVYAESVGSPLPLPVDAIYNAMNPQAFIRTRLGTGGPQLEQMIHQTRRQERELRADNRALAQEIAELAFARAKLENRFQEIRQGSASSSCPN